MTLTGRIVGNLGAQLDIEDPALTLQISNDAEARDLETQSMSSFVSNDSLLLNAAEMSGSKGQQFFERIDYIGVIEYP